MKRKFLEDLGLEKEVIDKILDENSSDIGKAKGEVDSITSERDKLKTDLADRDRQLETLKNSTGDVEAMKKQIADLQTENKTKDETHAAEIKQLKVDAAVDSAITAAKGKNAKAIKALLDMTKIDIDKDGNITGLDQIEALTTADDSKFLFDTSTKKTQMKGAKPGEAGKEDPDTKVDVSKMSYEELAAYMEENPDAEI